MTELREGRITAGKIQDDQHQINLGEPISNKKTHIETKIDNPSRNRAQWLLWWIMLIIAMFTVLNICSTKITCGPMLFDNNT